jgi:hypothetical protein
MGKHEIGYARMPRDLYPTPSWCIDALAQHMTLDGLTVWEPACGNFRMVNALRAHGAKVWPSDIAFDGHYSPRWRKRHTIDFTDGRPGPACDAIISNPPFGPRGTLAVKFIEAGLSYLKQAHVLCLLLPHDFDAASSRRALFGDCKHFAGKIVLTKRVVWFSRNDGVREAPKENTAWFSWFARPLRHPPSLLYAP